MKEQKVIPEAISKGIVAKRMQQCCLAALRDGQYGYEVADCTGMDTTWLTGPGWLDLAGTLGCKASGLGLGSGLLITRQDGRAVREQARR